MEWNYRRATWDLPSISWPGATAKLDAWPGGGVPSFLKLGIRAWIGQNMSQLEWKSYTHVKMQACTEKHTYMLHLLWSCIRKQLRLTFPMHTRLTYMYWYMYWYMYTLHVYIIIHYYVHSYVRGGCGSWTRWKRATKLTGRLSGAWDHPLAEKEWKALRRTKSQRVNGMGRFVALNWVWPGSNIKGYPIQ